jgi:ABC-type transport system involved in multi-copper enzyme maturation permease subunit
MSTALAPTTPRQRTAQTPLRVTQARVLLSEWTKFRSLRSTVWTLLIAAALMIGLGALFSAVTASQIAAGNVQEILTFNPITTSLNGTLIAQLAIGVLGVLVISGEYSTGMIRSSLTAVPKRLPMLWAKLAVFAGVTFAVTLIASVVSFLLGQALLGANLGVSLSAPTALRSVVGVALYVTVAGMIGVALGALFRNTGAAISTFVGVFFVLPLVSQLLPATWATHFVRYLPSNAGGALYMPSDMTNALAPWVGFGVLSGYAAVLIGLAAWRLRRVDA